jgi:hypothetical protein
MRHHLLQEQPDRIARLEAARGQHSHGVCLEPGIYAGTNVRGNLSARPARDRVGQVVG